MLKMKNSIFNVKGVGQVILQLDLVGATLRVRLLRKRLLRFLS